MTRFSNGGSMQRIDRVFARLAFSTAIIAVFVFPALAQQQEPGGKQLTVERLYSMPSLAGRPPQPVQWAPDGKRFTYVERKGSGRDAATGERKLLVSVEALQAVTQPEKAQTTQATGLGRVQTDNYRWSPDGNALLFAGSNSLALLDLKTMRPKTVLQSKEEIEHAKFSPDGKWISFV